ncbi:MAG: MATE family efflux transporter, partial [Fusobacterium sp.]
FKHLKIKKYIFPLGIMLLISNINILYTQLDRISLGFYVKNMSEVAYYSVSQKVMSIMVVIIMSIITVSMPRLSFYLGEKNQKEYEKLLNNLFKYSYLLLFPIAVGIIILSKEISLFFGGSLYLPAQTVVSIFGIRVIVIVIESLLSNQVIYLHQKEKTIALIYGICGFFNLILKTLLIKFNYFNASTAIFTTMLCEILIIFLDLLYIKNHLKINLKIFNFNSLKYFLFSLSFFGIKYILRNILLHYILYSILIFICCSLTYLVLLILSKDECLIEIISKLNLKKYFMGEKK